MAICVFQRNNNNWRTDPNEVSPDCTEFFLLTSQEYADAQSNALLPELSIEDSLLLTGAILTVWGIGWGARQIIRVTQRRG